MDLNTELKNKLKNTGIRIQLWKTINKYKIRKPYKNNNITQEQWRNFLKEMYPENTKMTEDIQMTDVRHPLLDGKISLKEMETTMKKLKLKKSPEME